MSKKSVKPLITKMVLINLHISTDSGRRSMKDLSKKIAQDNDANAEAISASFSLYPKELTRPFTTALSRCRRYYLENSLPWEDGNWRVVPVTKLNQFRDDLEKLISEAKDEFDRCFIKNYQKIKDVAEKRKGKISLAFPSEDELEKSFKIQYNMGAVASTDDIRLVGIDSALRKKLKKEIEDRQCQQIENGLKELASNLSSALDQLTERISEEDQKGKKYTRFLDNLKNMVQNVDDLNMTENETLKNACKNIRENISNWSPNAIKENKEVRENIAGIAGGLQEELAAVCFEDED